MLTANWDYDRVGDTRQWYLNNGRTWKLEMCVKRGGPGEWKTVREVTLPDEVSNTRQSDGCDWKLERRIIERCIKNGVPGEWVMVSEHGGWGCIKEGSSGEWVELPLDHKNGQWGFGEVRHE